MENILNELKRDLENVEKEILNDLEFLTNPNISKHIKSDNNSYYEKHIAEEKVLKKYIKLIEDNINNKVDESKSDDILIREAAMKWWNNLSSLRRTEICDTNTEIFGKFRRHESLTGREIEVFYIMFIQNKK